MDALHGVLRTIRSETKSLKTRTGREHLNVFREFLRHLDLAQKRRAMDDRSVKRKPRRKR